MDTILKKMRLNLSKKLNKKVTFKLEHTFGGEQYKLYINNNPTKIAITDDLLSDINTYGKTNEIESLILEEINKQ